MFDFTVKADDAELYVSSPALTGAENAQNSLVAFSGAANQCAGYIRNLISFLPMNSDSGIFVESCTDNLNRMIGELDFAGEARSVIATIADNGVFYEVSAEFAPSIVTAFATIGGVRAAIVANSFANNEGRLDVASARKISRFVNFCNSFSVPVVTLVDSNGLVIDKENEINFFAPELARLAQVYACANVPKVTVIIGHAIGASFVLLGSKALGADVVYCTDDAEVCALSAESGVAFAWDKYITLEKSRESLVEEWRADVASPARAAASGEIDDIISTNELRARICSALLMLCAKGQNAIVGSKVLPL
jgi:acetyl-CoA carboxylase carboxyltransferase component